MRLWVIITLYEWLTGNYRFSSKKVKTLPVQFDWTCSCSWAMFCHKLCTSSTNTLASCYKCLN